jgi:hypothetical protein
MLSPVFGSPSGRGFGWNNENSAPQLWDEFFGGIQSGLRVLGRGDFPELIEEKNARAIFRRGVFFRGRVGSESDAGQ